MYLSYSRACGHRNSLVTFSRMPTEYWEYKPVWLSWDWTSNGENLRFSRFRPSSLKCPSRYPQVPRLLSSWRALGGTYALAYLHTYIPGTGVWQGAGGGTRVGYTELPSSFACFCVWWLTRKAFLHQLAPSFNDRTLGQNKTEISENRDLSRIRVLCTSDGDLHN